MLEYGLMSMSRSNRTLDTMWKCPIILLPHKKKSNILIIYDLTIDVVDGPIQELQCCQNFANAT